MGHDGFSLIRPRGFGRSMSSGQGPLTVAVLHPPHPNLRYQPLPPPTGRAPFHLQLSDVLPPATVDAITRAGKMAFHVVGDVGGVKFPEPQAIVAAHLEQDVGDSSGKGGPVPAFLFLLGDVVYFFGAAAEYRGQFYEPYIHYPAPIFAVPGNHDGDVDPHAPAPSLQAFVENFCAAAPHLTPEAGDSTREAMIQPNVYWTLDCPFATIVGLYTNVPEGGQLDDHQIGWLHSELANAPTNKALMLTLHHPIFSGDTYHSGSLYMQGILETAIQQSGRSPDVVLSGHVHNYQRYTRVAGRTQVPYVVAGAGGYWHLHTMALHNGARITPPLVVNPGLTLESFVDDRHGFLHVEVSATELRGDYYTVPRPQESWSAPAVLFDSFVLDLKRRRLSRNGLHKHRPTAASIPQP